MPRIADALARARRWIQPSLGAGAAGALIGAIAEALLHVDGTTARLASIGYAVAGLWPTCAALAVVTRLLRRGWHLAPPGPAAVAAAPRSESDRAATWLAWGVVAALALTVLGWTGWITVVWASFHTAFHARTLAVMVPAAVVISGGLLAVTAPPCARGLAHLLAAVATRWQARRGTALLTPRRVGLGLALAVGLALALISTLLRQRLGALHLSVVTAPILALAVTAALHRRRRATPPGWRARALPRLAIALAALAVAGAATLRVVDPAQVLDAWSQPTVASEVIGLAHSLDALRGRVSPAAAALVPVPGAEHPDVVLITIDTLRADRAPPSRDGAAMPNLTALAGRGAAFTRAFAAGNVTRRSLPSLVTGLSPTRVRGQMYGWALRLDPRHVLLAERFAASGYQTAGFLCCEGFWSPARKLGLNRGLGVLQLTEDGALLAEQARAWLRQRASAGERRPLFLWMHFMEPHKWNGSAGLLPAPAQVLPKYDAALTRVDAILATVLDGLASLPRPPIIAITSDHGEGLGDHGAPHHASDLYNSQVRVPLIFAGPGVVPAQPAEVVGLIDVAPTLIELAGFALPPPPQLEGRSLASLLRGQRASDDEGGYAYVAMVQDRSIGERRDAVVRGRWKLISSLAGIELYDYVSDPGELHNLAGSAPELTTMRQLLQARQAIDAVSPFGKLSR